MLKVNYNYAKHKSSISVHIENDNDIIELSALKQRHVKIFVRYKKFTNLETIDWKAKSKYDTDYGVLTKEMWGLVFQVPINFNVSNSTKEIHFKVLHRIIALYKLFHFINYFTL